MLFDLMNVGISMLATQLFKGSEGNPPAIAAPPAYTPPPTPVLEEASSLEPDKTSSNAYKTEEKRRILASLPKATKTVLDQKGDEGTTKKKTLLGSGSSGGSTTLG